MQAGLQAADLQVAAPVAEPVWRGFERLIRKMLLLPQRPVVMYFHVWTLRRPGLRFFESPENMIEMVPEYYGLPSLSMCNAMYHIVENQIVPANWLWRSDVNHANCLGHRFACLGSLL
ncbi:g5376 [Coccomyxa elongata]